MKPNRTPLWLVIAYLGGLFTPDLFTATAPEQAAVQVQLYTAGPGQRYLIVPDDAQMVVRSTKHGVLHIDAETVEVQGVPRSAPPLPPDPTPDPPGPVVPPEPPVPVPSKVSAVLVVEETDQRTPELNRTLLGLRDGPAAKWFSSKGYKLDILDRDLKTPAVVAHAPYPKVPVLLVIDAAGKVLLREDLPATADGVVEAVKRVGG